MRGEREFDVGVAGAMTLGCERKMKVKRLRLFIFGLKIKMRRGRGQK